MKKYRIYAENAVFALSLLLIVGISACTTLYSDDFVYGTYFCDGLKGFVTSNARHYMTVNGRSLVHMVLELVLAFKDRLFFAVIPLILIMTAEMYFRSCTPEHRRIRRIGLYGIYLLGIMLIPLPLMREGILWMSGAMNYIFPTALLLTACWIIKRSGEGRTVGWYCFPIMFLCGASTEQCGAAAICVAVLLLIYSALNGQRPARKAFLLTAAMAAGYLTVILSPGTFMRMSEETTAAAEIFGSGFADLYYMTLREGRLMWLFLLTEGVLSVRISKKSISNALLGIAADIGAAVLYLVGAYTASGAVLTVIFVYHCFYMLWKGINPEDAALLLGGLLTIGMLAFSTTYGFRNLLPCCLIIICICSYNICELFDGITDKAFFALTALCLSTALICFLPTLWGYWSNRKIINENIANIKTSGDGFYYNADLDNNYSYNKYYDYDFYYEGFKRIYNIEENVKIYICGKDFEDLYCNGIHCENPIYIKNGIKYYPMRDVVEACGGSVQWDNDSREAVITLRDETVYYNSVMRLFRKGNREMSAEEYKLNEEDKYGRFFVTHVYMTEDRLKELFGNEYDGR